jgi:hypothetical protein
MKLKTFVLSIFLLITACESRPAETEQIVIPLTSMSAVECPLTSPTPAPMPSFLDLVFPVGYISMSEYEKTFYDLDNGGIQIEVSASGLDSSVLKNKDPKVRIKAMANRVQLIIDDTITSNDFAFIGDGLMTFGPFWMSWRIGLSEGYHKAKLLFDTDLGRTIYYSWEFCITP